MDSSEFLKMDIFFVVTTLVVALFGIIGCVLGYYLIRVVRDLSEISRTVKQQAQGLAEDFEAVRTDIKDGVHEVRENVTEGIATAKSYTKAVAGAGILRAVSNLFQAFSTEKASERTTRRRTRKNTKGEE
jgi:uncharacterized protein YoxC